MVENKGYRVYYDLVSFTLHLVTASLVLPLLPVKDPYPEDPEEAQSL